MWDLDTTCGPNTALVAFCVLLPTIRGGRFDSPFLVLSEAQIAASPELSPGYCYGRGNNSILKLDVSTLVDRVQGQNWGLTLSVLQTNRPGRELTGLFHNKCHNEAGTIG